MLALTPLGCGDLGSTLRSQKTVINNRNQQREQHERQRGKHLECWALHTEVRDKSAGHQNADAQASYDGH